MKKFFYLIILISAHSYSQRVTGYLYDQDSRVPDFPILNATQNVYSSSDSSGRFEIPANVGDTILLNSIAYKPYILEVKKSHLGNDIVIELEPEDLEEVTVFSSKTDSKTLSNNLNNSIKKDIVSNPTFYEPSRGNIGYILHKLMGLFNKDDNSGKESGEERKLKTEDLMALFKNDKLLNENFLAEELKIPEKYHVLFLDYLGSKELSYTYLQKERRLELMDLIYKYNTEYQSEMGLSENGEL